jgi:hypothetical protein
MTDEEKRHYWRVYKQLRKGQEPSEDDRKFYADMRERLEKEGITSKDPTVQEGQQGEPAPPGQGTPQDAPATAASPEQPPVKKAGKRRPPLEIPFPAAAIAKTATRALYSIEVTNRAAGFPGLPDELFTLYEILLTDAFEEMKAKGIDVRKYRNYALLGGAGVVVVQGGRRMYDQRKKRKAKDANGVQVLEHPTAATGAPNGVASEAPEEKPAAAPTSKLKEGDM